MDADTKHFDLEMPVEQTSRQIALVDSQLEGRRSVGNTQGIEQVTSKSTSRWNEWLQGPVRAGTPLRAGTPVGAGTNGRGYQWARVPMGTGASGRWYQWTLEQVGAGTNGRRYQWALEQVGAGAPRAALGFWGRVCGIHSRKLGGIL